MQTDVTERVRVEREREAAFAAEQAARQEAELARAIAEQARRDAERAQADAERAQGRLALMAEATSTLIATLDMARTARPAGRRCACPRLADWVFLTLVDEYGDVSRTPPTGTGTGTRTDLRQFTALHVRHLPPTLPEPAEHRHVPAGAARRTSPRRCSQTVFARPGGAWRPSSGWAARSVLTVPMVARRRTLGAIALVRTSDERSVHPGRRRPGRGPRRPGRAGDGQRRLYQREHAVADTLQRSLLPVLPEVAGIESAAHYVSASSAADVGGDFYDLLDLPDGSSASRSGDVVGHDVAAAAAMGHLRGVLRAASGTPRTPTPARCSARVDRLVQGLRVASLATMVYARAVRPAARGRALAGARRQRRPPAGAAARTRRERPDARRR